MADEAKTLEMRVAELEDKLSKIHITEDEMKAFQKVSTLLGGAAPPAAGAAPQAAGSVLGCISECIIRQCCIIRNCTILRHCTIIRDCIIRQCFECFECGGGWGGGGLGGGGFGSLGG